jgi:DNA-binding NarL/FixJ family response regulator
MERDRRAALSAGYEVHIPKPVDPASLVETVRKLAHGEMAGAH